MNRETLYLDFETTPIIGCGWTMYTKGAAFFHVLKHVQIMSVAWSWEGEDEVYCTSLPEFKGHKAGLLNVNDKKLVESFIPIFNKARVIVAHNGKGFDFTLWRTRLIVHGFDPYPEMEEIDTKQWAKRFKFTTNRQDNIADQLGTQRKMRTRKELHIDCLEHNIPEAWKENDEYNKVDVIGMKENAHKMAPFIKNHIKIHLGSGMKCRNVLCQSQNLVRRGPRRVKGGQKQAHQCKDCGCYTDGPLIPFELTT